MTDETYQKWAVKVAKTAADNKDKTLRQLIKEKRVPTWISYFLGKLHLKEKTTTDPFDILAQMGGLK